MLAYTSAAVFLFSALALVVPSGFSLGALMLMLGALALLRGGRRPLRVDRKDWPIFAAFALYFVVSVLNNLAHHAPAPEYDAPLRFLLALPALLLLRAIPPRQNALWGGVAIGAIGAFLLSLWQLKAGIDRPSGSTNPIQYGNISVLLGILSACGLLWAVRQPRARAWCALLVVGALAGASASMISGSRGSWLAIPACLIAGIYPLVRAGGTVLLGKVLLVCVVVAVGLWLVPQTGLRNRTELAVTQANHYEQRSDADSSVGARMEMLRIGLLMAPQHLMLGWGKRGMFDYKAQLVDSGQAAPSVREHTHLHNEYLDALVKHGVPGLLAALLLFLVPLAAFGRQLYQHGEAPNASALAGVMLMASYLAFGLTQAFLTHNNGVMILAFMAIILWCASRTPVATPQTH